MEISNTMGLHSDPFLSPSVSLPKLWVLFFVFSRETNHKKRLKVTRSLPTEGLSFCKEKQNVEILF